ncbi:MobC family plasmid mobilization relaxosome protein [Marinobacterium rhizophilum]|uniref:MobC family plasmid mobilization relaxosome protein n=1 Tax=Marinobacterium rhizophilum TaxID=420402 RepID=UPI000382CB4B|nr:MobC family plasmid mobilization relaxosome protein [Marinobacterium rhizophilum]
MDSTNSKTARINLALTPGDKKRLKRLALEADLTPSELVSGMLDRLVIQRVQPRAHLDDEGLRELRRIGTNLNQVAHQLNIRSDADVRASLADLQQAFTRLYQRVLT